VRNTVPMDGIGTAVSKAACKSINQPSPSGPGEPRRAQREKVKGSLYSVCATLGNRETEVSKSRSPCRADRRGKSKRLRTATTCVLAAALSSIHGHLKVLPDHKHARDITYVTRAQDPD